MSFPEHKPGPVPTEPTRWFTEEVLPLDRPLRAYLSRSLPSQADVDDVAQDSYVRMLKAREKGTIHKTKAFLFAVARNVVRTWLQKKASTNEVPITESDGEPVLQSDDDVFETICRQQELVLLTEAINTLPKRCREVVLLRKIKGLSQREIASMLGISENTVESLASKGVRRCADYLRTHGAARKSNDV